MRCHTAAHCEDTLCYGHTSEVFRRCLDADEHDFAFLFAPGFCFFSREYDLAGGCAGRCGKTLCHDFCALECCFVEHGVEEFIEFLRFHALEHGFFIDFACAEKVHSDLYHCSACAFAVAGLEHPEFAVLDGEFHILHVFVVVFKTACYCDELGGADGH